MSPERHFRTSPGRQIGTSPRRQIGTSPERSNRIFRASRGDVGGGGGPWDVLGTNICRLGVNQLFVLSFENENDRASHSTYYLPKVEIKD